MADLAWKLIREAKGACGVLFLLSNLLTERRAGATHALALHDTLCCDVVC